MIDGLKKWSFQQDSTRANQSNMTTLSQSSIDNVMDRLDVCSHHSFNINTRHTFKIWIDDIRTTQHNHRIWKRMLSHGNVQIRDDTFHILRITSIIGQGNIVSGQVVINTIVHTVFHFWIKHQRITMHMNNKMSFHLLGSC